MIMNFIQPSDALEGSQSHKRITVWLFHWVGLRALLAIWSLDPAIVRSGFEMRPSGRMYSKGKSNGASDEKWPGCAFDDELTHRSSETCSLKGIRRLSGPASEGNALSS